LHAQVATQLGERQDYTAIIHSLGTLTPPFLAFAGIYQYWAVLLAASLSSICSHWGESDGISWDVKYSSSGPPCQLQCFKNASSISVNSSGPKHGFKYFFKNVSWDVKHF
jgi:hypothetical protein